MMRHCGDMAGARPSYAGVLDPLAADDWDDSCATGLEDSEDTTSDNPAYGSLLGVKRDDDAPKKAKKMAISLGANEMAKAAEVMEINAGQLMTNPQRSERITELTGFDPFEMEDEDSLDDVEEAFSAALAGEWDEDEASEPVAEDELPEAIEPLEDEPQGVFPPAPEQDAEEPVAEDPEWREEPVEDESYDEDQEAALRQWAPDNIDLPAEAGWEAQAPELGMSGERPKRKMAIQFDHSNDEEAPEEPQDWQAFEQAALGDEAPVPDAPTPEAPAPEWPAEEAEPAEYPSQPEQAAEWDAPVESLPEPELAPQWDAFDREEPDVTPEPPEETFEEVELEAAPDDREEPIDSEPQWQAPQAAEFEPEAPLEPEPQWDAPQDPEPEAPQPAPPAFNAEPHWEERDLPAPTWHPPVEDEYEAEEYEPQEEYAEDEPQPFDDEPQWAAEPEPEFAEAAEEEFEPSTPAFDIFAEREPITVDQVKAPIPFGLDEYTNRHQLRARVVGNYTPEVTLSQRIGKALVWLAKRAWNLARALWAKWRG